MSGQLCLWASNNTRGATLVDMSPRFARERAHTSLRGGFGSQLCFAQEHLAVGAVLYHYDVTSNIGTVLDLVSALSIESRASRGQALRMLRVLLDQMVTAMDEEAVLNGQLAGCNAIFVVTSSASRDPHRMLAALKCFCLDFPLQRFMGDVPPEGFALGVMLTQQVPMTPVPGGSVAEGGRFYVPAIVLERFFRLQTALGSLLGLDLEKSLQTQLAKLSVRSKIPTTAWARELKWMVVNLREDYDETLLRNYHRLAAELLDPKVLSPLSALQEALQDDDDSKNSTHVLVALYWSDQRAQFDIVGGVQVCFLVASNTAVVQSWFLARPGKSHNRRHECSRVLARLLDDMRAQAVTHGHIAGLDGLFLEAASADGNVLDVGADHVLLAKLGFRKVQMDYETPEGVPAVLAVLTDDNTPRSEFDPRLMFLPEVLVRETLQERWAATLVGATTTVPSSMLRQVRMQEERGVLLLDTPWTGTEALSGVLVDLYDDWDESLASSLFRSLPPESVEPFHVWRALMADDDGVSPMLTANRARSASGSSLSGSLSGAASVASRDAKPTFELHALVPLVASTVAPSPSPHMGLTSDEQARPAGEGLLLHYYACSNSGVISHLQLAHGRPVGPILDKARDVLDRCARERGYLSGCNCVFLEIAAEHVGATRVEEYHAALHDSGFRLVGCSQYEAPKRTAGPWSRHQDELMVPLAPHAKRGVMLLAYRGEFVPIDIVMGDFLPSNVVRGFVVDRWHGAWESGLVGEQPENNPAFVQMMQSLGAVAKVPLQDLPWSAQSSEQWIYVNLGRNYDEALLSTWYYQILKPNFPMDDEVESLESFKQGLLAEPNDDDAMLLEIVLAVRWEGNQSVIGGGVVYEYYFDSNCGLISFLVVSRVARGQGLSRILVEMAAQELEVLSVEDGGALAGCNAIFLETNAAQAVTMEQDVMDPRLRHLIYHKMGFKLVDFPYVMPPLGLGMPKVYYLLLLVYMTHKIPTDPILDERFLPGILLQRFFHDQWKHALQYGRLACKPQEDPDYAVTISSLELTGRVPLRDYPWVKSRPWTVINLREHNDPELLAQIIAALHDVYPAAARKDFPEVEFCASLNAPEGEVAGPVWQAVVGLMPPRVDDVDMDSLQLELVAMLLMLYDPALNMGRIVFDCARASAEAGLSQDLLDRGVAQMEASAIRCGHLGGCSAVLVSVATGEETLLGPVTGMKPMLTRASAAALGFWEVSGVQITPSDALLVLETPDIPKSETGGLHLPARLIQDYAVSIKMPPKQMQSLVGSRKFFPLRKIAL